MSAHLSDAPNVAAQDAVDRFSQTAGSVRATLVKLEAWADAHDRRAACGEAREDAATQVDAITAKLQMIDAQATLLLVAARKVAA